ncbi:RNase H domain-containing protein [Trichonephila clavipes]|nr:RNase H domain-containing protein [Trichonephila clavipes]
MKIDIFTELHVFVDASKGSYAGCVFARSIVDSRVSVILVRAKSRVAPLKLLSIPRLELIFSLNIALFMEKGALASRRLDFYLLVHGRYFISLLPPIGNQWRRSPIRHLGTRPLGVTGSDSKSAIEAIRNGETNISCDIITLLEQLHNKRKSCILQWIPAHVNIEVTEFDCPRIITSTIARLRTEHLKGMKIHPDKTRSYVQCKHCPDLQLTPNHILECPTVATKLLKMGMVPMRDSLRELLYSPDAPRIAEAVIKTFDGI